MHISIHERKIVVTQPSYFKHILKSSQNSALYTSFLDNCKSFFFPILTHQVVKAKE